MPGREEKGEIFINKIEKRWRPTTTYRRHRRLKAKVNLLFCLLGGKTFHLLLARYGETSSVSTRGLLLPLGPGVGLRVIYSTCRRIFARVPPSILWHGEEYRALAFFASAGLLLLLLPLLFDAAEGREPWRNKWNDRYMGVNKTAQTAKEITKQQPAGRPSCIYIQLEHKQLNVCCMQESKTKNEKWKKKKKHPRT